MDYEIYLEHGCDDIVTAPKRDVVVNEGCCNSTLFWAEIGRREYLSWETKSNRRGLDGKVWVIQHP
jgi:hypothetical protein